MCNGPSERARDVVQRVEGSRARKGRPPPHTHASTQACPLTHMFSGCEISFCVYTCMCLCCCASPYASCATQLPWPKCLFPFFFASFLLCSANALIRPQPLSPCALSAHTHIFLVSLSAPSLQEARPSLPPFFLHIADLLREEK